MALWSILITLIVTLLGSLITTYVFLKQSLDRTVDEKPYYEEVIHEYREEIMHRLLRYSTVVLSMIGIVVIYCGMVYFLQLQAAKPVKIILIVIYLLCLAYNGRFLNLCVDVNSGFYDAAEKLLNNKRKMAAEHLGRILGGELKKEWDSDLKKNLEWMDVAECEYLTKWVHIDDERFIDYFSEWEKLLLLLVEPEQGFYSRQSLGGSIKMALENGRKVFDSNAQSDDFEDNDSRTNGWESQNYENMKKIKKRLARMEEDFCDSYALLAEYRNLLQVKLEINRNTKKSDWSNDDAVCAILFFFVLYLQVRVLEFIPKIVAFYPGGKFQYMNFYDARFEDSAFRSSIFKDGVFSRSKIKNSNFSMALFENCELFSTDSRDCSFSNVKLDTCNLQEAIFVYSDFTNAVFKKCKAAHAQFLECILSNMIVRNTDFAQADFSNSKIWNVTIQDNTISNCNFSGCDIHNIEVVRDKTKEHYQYTGENYILQYYFKIILEEMEDFYWHKNAEKTESGQRKEDIEKSVHDFEAETLDISNSFFICAWKEIENASSVCINECNFSETIMPEMKFYRISLAQSVFINSQIKGGHFINAYMPGCIMNNVNMRSGILFGVNMEGAVLDDAILFQAECKLVNLRNASLKRLHASETKMVWCQLDNSDCKGMVLTNSEIETTSFRETILSNADFTETRFIENDFTNTYADFIVAPHTKFEKCSFETAHIKGALLNYAKFMNCNFSQMEISDTTINEAIFERCNFNRCRFVNVTFINVCFKKNIYLKKENFVKCKFIKDSI